MPEAEEINLSLSAVHTPILVGYLGVRLAGFGILGN
jgi:hypothetical protein